MNATGIDADVDEFADVLVGHDFEGECGKTRVFARAFFLRAVRLRADDWRNVQRGGEVIDDGVQQSLDAFVTEGGAAEDGADGLRMRRLADGFDDFNLFDWFVRAIFVKQFFILFGDAFDKVFTPWGGVFEQFVRKRTVFRIGPFGAFDIDRFCFFCWLLLNEYVVWFTFRIRGFRRLRSP